IFQGRLNKDLDMHDTTRSIRTSDLAALAQATDATGQVDLTAYQGYRLMKAHQTLDGLDARGVVAAIVSSPVYADARGRAQVGSLIEAISSRLPASDAKRFDAALDVANVGESWVERDYERYVEEPMGAAARDESARAGQALAWTDRQISDNLAATRRWAETARETPHNRYLDHAAGEVAGGAQESYGALKGAIRHGLGMLGETVDLAKFAHQFSTDRDFRNLVIGAASVYASEAIEDPAKLPRDLRHAAVGAWNTWKAGLEQAIREGKEHEYLGNAKGAAAVEIIATFVPTTKLTKLARVAAVADAGEELAPTAGRTLSSLERRQAGALSETLAELVQDARRVQGKGGLEADGANLMFHGLAGVKRSQGALGALVDELRRSSNLDGLLQSGALSPKELAHLARSDVSLFDGQVSFHAALDAAIGKRELTSLKNHEVGAIGEALVSYELAAKGYRDLVPIQNNSGHGIDLAGINPETNRWEIFEVKASVQGIARRQGGDPEDFLTVRLNRAASERGLEQGLWAPQNMWEEQAQAMAARIIEETRDRTTGKLDIKANWARVNIDRDPATGAITGTPEIEKGMTPAERRHERSLRNENAPPARSPADAEHPDHAMHQQIKGKVEEPDRHVGRSFDAISERMTASLLVLAKDNGLTQVDHVGLSRQANGVEAAQKVFVVQGWPTSFSVMYAGMPTVQAAHTPVEQSHQ
ncbi:XVIPCD domain-containing protein, partial [Xanthomonas fragariae]